MNVKKKQKHFVVLVESPNSNGLDLGKSAENNISDESLNEHYADVYLNFTYDLGLNGDIIAETPPEKQQSDLNLIKNADTNELNEIPTMSDGDNKIHSETHQTSSVGNVIVARKAHKKKKKNKEREDLNMEKLADIIGTGESPDNFDAAININSKKRNASSFDDHVDIEMRRKKKKKKSKSKGNLEYSL